MPADGQRSRRRASLPALEPVPVASIPRLQDWESRLVDAIGSTPGVCVELAAAAVIAVVGIDPIAQLRRVLRRSQIALLEHYGPIDAATTTVLGAPMLQYSRALRGDVALVELPTGEHALGVIMWPYVVARCDASETAVLHLPPTAIRAAWPIGMRAGVES